MLADSTLIKNTDQCVMCGLCLPHCPTYRVSRNEGESPRGRISLIKAYAQGELDAGSAIQTHLQSCTACMQCEQVCPAEVAYQSILDSGRQLYRPRLSLKTRSLQSLGLFLLTKKRGHRWFKVLQAAASVAAKTRLFSSFEMLQFATVLQQQKTEPQLPQEMQSSQKVTIFSGCSADLLDRKTFNSTLKIVAALGYQPHTPQQHLCCSALAQHSGFPELATSQRRNAHEYLHAHDVISFASGCGRQLENDGINNTARHYDIHDWLQQDNKLTRLQFKPLNKKVLLHTPCSLQSKQADAMEQVLRNIPAVTVQKFNDDLHCCGAGGMQILTPQASNQALLQSKIAAIKELQPDVIVTANVGCSLQLQKGLLQANTQIPVLHTVSLLAEHLREP